MSVAAIIAASITKGAIISACGQYRYRLWRHWGPRPHAIFIMLNPSTADADADDPTIRKCIGFAKRLGRSGIEVVNLYAYRATKPADLRAMFYPVGPDNDGHIKAACAAGDGTAICAWGAHARGLVRPDDVLEMLRWDGITPMALALTDDGIPRHPLMLPYTDSLVVMP